ncbi:MAG TPA: pyridoxamine 5'-phosphate oxidase family protein [Myxococcales bacterium]|jgi:predicted pyridoxine 5'-phosphate oxidase superfamily flavin-nucleotide-binding protein|nr:pyridoxamine 5'-phosphate oxidase family protein [Myxococcales bacterium]
MGERFYAETFTPEVRAAQRHYHGRDYQPAAPGEREALGPAELEFIAQRDSFYMATVSSQGWPYVQHRGGPKGFLRALGPSTLAFADFKGNKQLISTGNLANGGKVALILVDYVRRERLKVLGVASIADVRDRPPALEALVAPEHLRKVERLVVIDVVAFDWNCPAYITPRYATAPRPPPPSSSP